MPIEHPASDISFDPVGELNPPHPLAASDVQAALEELDLRTRVGNFLDDRKVGFNLKEEFLGGSNYPPPGGWIGQNRWSIPSGITGPAPSVVQSVVQPAFGVIAIGTEVANDWNNINLGTVDLVGAPLFHMQCRVRFTNLNSSSHKSSFHIGLHNDINGIEPSTGMYFRYMEEAGGPVLKAVVANGGSRTHVPTGVAPNTISFYWLEIISDGAGVIRFYVNEAETNVITTNLPSGSNRYGPSMTVRRTQANTSLFRSIHVDTFDLRVEGAR